MPVGFNSPARNLFLLGSSGAQVVTNFFKTIDQSAGTDGVYLPDEIKYNFLDQKFVLAGSAQDSNSKEFGWLEKRDDAGTADFENRIEATQSGVNTTLNAMELDVNDNLVVVGRTGNIPWIAKYSNGGVIDWQSTSNTADVSYTGITSDSNGQYYACGYAVPLGVPVTSIPSFVEKFDANGNPGWGKQAFMLGSFVGLNKIAANNRGEVVAVGYIADDDAQKGYIVKIDTNTGEVLWDRTLRSYEEDATFGYTPVQCINVFIDSRDQIYVVGRRNIGLTDVRGFIIKYTAEGNMIWQKETPEGENIEYWEVKSDGETEQTIVFGRYIDSANSDVGGVLSKYSRDGSLVWRRTLFSSYNNSDTFGDALGRGVCLDADPSFYYLLYFDDAYSPLNGTPEAYTFGKVSSSGNGLGGFEYEEGTGQTLYYDILNVQDKIGRLSDGSVRQDTSDLITYPFNANKLLFDDLATQVSNKKRQMDSADSFEYSGSPAIRVADFQELNLLGESIVVGPELITNGDFSNGTTGWSNNPTEILTVNGGVATVDRNGGSAVGQCYQTILTEVGRSYTVSVLVTAITNGFQVYANSGSTGMSQGAVNSTGTHYWTFTAVGSSTRLDFSAVQNVNGTASFDNISVKEYSWLDTSGKGNNGKVYGGLTANTSAGYWEFDGLTDYIEIDANSDVANITGDISIEAWFNIDTTNDGNRAIWSKGRTPDPGGGTQTHSLLWVSSSNTIGGLIGNLDGTPSSVGQTIITAGQWYHVVLTSDGSNNRLYINGVLDDTTARTSAEIYNTNQTGGVSIGRDVRYGNNGSRNWDGRIGEVRVYPRALTAAQVFQNFNATKSKYINEAPDTAPKIGPGIVYGSNLLLNYDFGNRATYDRTNQNLVPYSQGDNWISNWTNVSATILSTTERSPVGTNDAVKYTGTGFALDVSMTSGNTYVWSLYVKVVDAAGDTIKVGHGASQYGSAGNFTANISYNLSDWSKNYSPSGDNAYIYDVVPVGDGWYRIGGKAYKGDANQGQFEIYIGNMNATVMVWGPQLEEWSGIGAFESNPPKASRYFGTTGTAVNNVPTTVKNLSSTSLTGTIYSGVYNSDGYFTDNGTNFYIGSNINTSLSGGTMEAWIWFDNVNQNQGMFQIGPGGAGPYINFYSPGASQQKMRWEVIGNTGSPYTTILSNTNLSTGQWYHFVGTFDGASTTTLYVNGTQDVQQTNMSNQPTSVNAPVTIGNYAGALDGRIGETRFYNRALSATEVSQNFNATRAKYGV